MATSAARFQGYLQSLRSLVRSSEDGERVTDRWLFIYVGVLFIAGLVVSFLIKIAGSKGVATTVREVFGVPLKKLRRTVREIERKTFHMMGLLVPLIYQLLLGIGWTEMECAMLCWGITISGWVADLSRIYVPIVRDNWPLRSILREHEQGQLSGGCFFSLGCTLAITLFSHATATASIAFLVVGDMRYGYCHLSITASPKQHITHPHAPCTSYTPCTPLHRIHTPCVASATRCYACSPPPHTCAAGNVFPHSLRSPS